MEIKITTHNPKNNSSPHPLHYTKGRKHDIQNPSVGETHRHTLYTTRGGKHTIQNPSVGKTHRHTLYTMQGGKYMEDTSVV